MVYEFSEFIPADNNLSIVKATSQCVLKS